ncbi:glycosyltransferase family 2 protein [Lacinutrix jangbogonensis]|uniref:glycosyltransferase family 2 protein n=1 Tax=Lacinutrix jangbogonensis TaxID=1469557 RepID=UPI000689FCC6|nr:glycosyltransferase family 2 protein [Lacinutrix jangbogonensis]
MNPFFTIIIPTYNVEKLLPESLNSILEQNYNDYEVIIMDGLSKDNTAKLAQQYAKTNPKIKVFSEKDSGIYDAMNKSIARAKGAYLFFLGSDDTFYNKDVLSNIYTEIKNTNADVVYGSVCSTKYGSKYDGAFTYEKLTTKNIGHQAIFFSKSVFKEIGDFNLKYKALADWDHNIRWFFSSKIKSKYVDLIVANYAEGGFSDQYVDLVFNRDKSKILFKHGLFKLKTNKLIKIISELVNSSKLENKYLAYSFYNTVVIALKALKIIRKMLYLVKY